MAEHANVELVRDAYDAFVKGDMEAVGKAFADDIVVHDQGRSPFAGDYVSKDEVFRLFGRLAEMTAGTFHQEIDDIIGNDTKVVVLGTERAERNGRQMSSPSALVWRIEDGKIVEAWSYYTDQYTRDEFYN
jgi:ketosteroid isomerase-like protein